MTNAITTARVIIGFDLPRSKKVCLNKLKNKLRSGDRGRVNCYKEKCKYTLGRQKSKHKCFVMSKAWHTREAQRRPLLPLQVVGPTEALIYLKSKYISLLLPKLVGQLLFPNATQMVGDSICCFQQHWKRTRLGGKKMS